MSKIKEALNEAEKEKKKGKNMLPELHALDDKIEDFIQKLEGKINGVKDNPIFVRKAHQLLGDMSKEYSEFLAALRAIVNAVDRKGQVLPKENPIGKVRDINSRFRSSDENRPDQEGEEGEEEVGPEGEIPPKKGVKEALLMDEAKKEYTDEDWLVYNTSTGEIIKYLKKPKGRKMGNVAKHFTSSRDQEGVQIGYAKKHLSHLIKGLK